MGAAFALFADGLLPLSIFLFEATSERRRWMLPFLIVGAGTSVYSLWGLMAYPLEVSVRANSIVYFNNAINNDKVAVLYVVAYVGVV